MYKRPILVVDWLWGYAGKKCHESPKLLCFFREFGKCRFESLKGKNLPSPSFLKMGKNAATSLGNTGRYRSGKDDSKPLWLSSKKSEFWIPQKMVSQIHSFVARPNMKLKCVLLHHLFRMSKPVEIFFKKNVYGALDEVTRPYVALHIRRTDKVNSEAKEHSIFEYFEHVERFFASRKNVRKNVPKTHRPSVFIATDEPAAVKEAREMFGEKYNIVNLGEASKVGKKRQGSATNVNDEGTMWTLADILILANSDFLIGTFSSQISRLAFEIMSARIPTAVYEKQQKRAPDFSRPMWIGREKPFQIPPHEYANGTVMAVSLDDYHYFSNMGARSEQSKI